MTDKAVLAELLERVEKATGPDRMLDALLWDLEDARPREHAGHSLRIYKRDPDDGVAFDTAPAYTASLDAALALVERVLPGWCKSAVDLRPEPCEGYVWERGVSFNIQGNAATPALALLCALLRALTTTPDRKRRSRWLVRNWTCSRGLPKRSVSRCGNWPRTAG